MGTLISLRQVAQKLGLSEQRIYQMDAELQPVYVRRGSKMKTRMYDESIVERVRIAREVEALERPSYPAGIRALWTGQLAKWKRAGVEGEMAIEDFIRLSAQQCHYCGAVPEKRTAGEHEVLANGIDLQDGTKGLEQGNAVTCCAKCETLRTLLSSTELLDHAKKIVEWQEGKLSPFRFGLMKLPWG